MGKSTSILNILQRLHEMGQYFWAEGVAQNAVVLAHEPPVANEGRSKQRPAEVL